jgi:hypothetical protein
MDRTVLESAAAQARRAIHANDIEELKHLIAEYPALLSWHDDEEDGGLLGMATSAYGDSFDPERERTFTRAACAELLIDAGAIVTPSVSDGLIRDRPRGLLRLFERKGVLPRTLKFRAALGDLDAVRAVLDGNDDRKTVNDAFLIACRFEHETVASLLLDRSIALDPDLGRHVDESGGGTAFITYLIQERSLEFVDAAPSGPWQAFVMEQVMRALQDGDAAAFVRRLQREKWLLGEEWVGFQVGLLERATLRDREHCLIALIDLDPALLRQQPPPPSKALEFAFTYAKPHLIPILTRIWPMPDDLPHAAGLGNLARAKRWFDESSAPTPQPVLDTALAWSVINRHFDVADFLLEHGADINTRWNSHEPASILHHLVFYGRYESMRFLIDRGIDMTITDYRWNSTAEGWARYGANDEKMAEWLKDAERQRVRGATSFPASE